MGSRCKKKCIVIDLDGTLIRGNTLHLLMRWLAWHYPLSAAPRLLWIAFRRLVGIDSHVNMKIRVLNIACGKMSDDDLTLFMRSITSRVNRTVYAMVQKYDYSILATAAPDFYAYKLSLMLGFDACVSSALDSIINEGKELRGVRKCKRVHSIAQELGLDIAAVVTDHKDDLPLLRVSGVSRFLVDPADELRMILDAEMLPYTVIIGRLN